MNYSLTPVYMIVIMLSYAFWDYLGTGPMWQNANVNALLSYCPSNWWQNALYINNLFDFDKQVTLYNIHGQFVHI
jgi:hypothetical protein